MKWIILETIHGVLDSLPSLSIGDEQTTKLQLEIFLNKSYFKDNIYCVCQLNVIFEKE